MKKIVMILTTCVATLAFADATPVSTECVKPKVVVPVVKKKKVVPVPVAVCVPTTVEKVVYVASAPVIQVRDHIVDRTIEKVVRPHHHLQLLGGVGPSGLQFKSNGNGTCFTDTIQQEYGLVGGVGYSYFFNNGFSLGLQGLTTIPQLNNVTGLLSVGKVW